MATQAPSPSPFSRLSRLAFPFKSTSPSSASPEPQTEDWYIPYNGPYEPPKGSRRNTDSWGHLVSGWLMEGDGEKSGHGYGQVPPRIRALSNASRTAADEHKRKSSRIQTSFIKLDQAGGIGDVPVPARPRRSQEAPAQHRASFASILSLSKQKAAAHRQLQHSTSVGTLRDSGRESGDGRARSYSNSHSNSHSNSMPHAQGVMSRPQEGSSLPHSQPQAAAASGFPVRPHPYAYATPAAPPLSASTPSPVQPSPRAKTPKFTVQLLEPLARKPSAPAYLLPASRPSRLSLKASMSTPNLRAATGTGSVLPKGKQRWLSAETWCDALFLPRPRFALRVMDGEGGSGRTVSPPPLPMWPPGAEPTPTAGKPTGAKPKQLKKSQSAVQLASRPSTAPSPSPPRPPPVRDDQARAGPSISPQKPPPQEDGLKPYRPKSWAQDDLALPSPVPSLAKVLEDGRKLHEDRKAWQEQAAKALDRRAGTFSRARSKSLGNRAASHARNPSTFETLTEATLLGNQRRHPTVHVRVKPPRSDGHATSSGAGTNTITGTGTGTGTGLGTFASTSQGLTHGHSNSLGSTSQGPSEESFMWAPGHKRSRSFGRSALRVVRTTAHTAAALCGKNTGSPVEDGREKAGPPLNEKAAAMEEALRHDGTKFITLRDQVAREQGQRDNGIVVITPPLDASNTQTTSNSARLSPGGPRGLSPTPSTSAEGVGIAISTPLPTPQPGEDVFAKEPIRIPAHPYAQGSASHPYYQRTAGRTLIQTNVRSEESSPSPSGSAGGDSITMHRQPVKHPYSPYQSIQHPFAAITGTSNDAAPGPSTQPVAGGNYPPSKHQDARPSPLSSMFAELSSGKIREIMPDEIQYSPFIPTPPVRLSAFVAARSKLSAHPYGPPTNRISEWGFAEALNFTMERRDSEDSGVGSSEGHELPPVPIAPEPSKPQEGPPFRRLLDDQDDTVVLSPEREEFGEDGLDPHSRSASGSCRRGRTGVSSRSNHTLASSMLENDHPPSSRHGLPPHERSFNSSRSSPGLVSAQSSPPLSPHLFQSSDLQEFNDLFYKPENATPPKEPPPISRNQSGSFQMELNTRSTRSISGLTTLARQLDENAEEMQDDEGFDHVEPMWRALHGGEAGRRPVDVRRERPEMVSKSSSGSGYRREGTQSSLQLHIDADLVLSQPVDVVPTDVESSRASSMLEMPFEDNPAHMRVGEIEAVSTPSVFAQPQRFSTHLTEMDYDDTMLSPRSGGTRVVSGESSLGVPFSSDATRSSFMTNTSGMSRLSDFPAPPSQITPCHMSILNAYYRDSARDSRLEEQDSSRPGLVREPSHATFGGRQEIGEAL